MILAFIPKCIYSKKKLRVRPKSFANWDKSFITLAEVFSSFYAGQFLGTLDVCKLLSTTVFDAGVKEYIGSGTVVLIGW